LVPFPPLPLVITGVRSALSYSLLYPLVKHRREINSSLSARVVPEVKAELAGSAEFPL